MIKDFKKLAFATSILMGIVLIVVSILLALFGIFLYELNPAMPGILALGIVGVWAAHNFTSFLNHWLLAYFCDRDLKQGCENG